MHRFALLLFVLFVPSSTLAGSPTAELAAGEILVNAIPVPNSYYPKVHVEAVVEAPPTVVWDILTDCKRSEVINSNVLKSRVIKREGADVICLELIDMPWPLRNLESVARWKFSPGPPVWKRSWTLVRGDFDYANGSWTVKRFDGDPKRSHVVYENHFSPKISVPDWLTKGFLKVGMPSMIKDLRAAAER